MILLNLSVGDLFSFSKDGAVHMISRIDKTFSARGHIEYKSYNDGKIRVETNMQKVIYLRHDFDLKFEIKWFKQL